MYAIYTLSKPSITKINIFYLKSKAKNEPDFYETSNISPINIKTETVQDDSSNVQKIEISLKDAQDKFNTNSLNSEYVGMCFKVERNSSALN